MEISFSVRLPVDSSSVPFARGLCTSALAHLDVEQQAIDDIALGLTEACANVVRHAEGAGHYEVRVEIDYERCRISVHDQGAGFESPSPAAAVAGSVLENGRGLFLMQTLMDDLQFRQDPDGAGHSVVLEKRLAGRSAS